MARSTLDKVCYGIPEAKEASTKEDRSSLSEKEKRNLRDTESFSIMSYLKETDTWLDERGITTQELKREIKTKILESYYNGRRDCVKYLYGALKALSNGKSTDKKGKQEAPAAKQTV